MTHVIHPEMVTHDPLTHFHLLYIDDLQFTMSCLDTIMSTTMGAPLRALPLNLGKSTCLACGRVVGFPYLLVFNLVADHERPAAFRPTRTR